MGMEEKIRKKYRKRFFKFDRWFVKAGHFGFLWQKN